MCVKNEHLRSKQRQLDAALKPVDLDLDPLPWQQMNKDERRKHESELEAYFEGLYGIRKAECCSPSSSDGVENKPPKQSDHDAKVVFQGAKILLWLED